jgi:hypothetical protein
MTKALYRLIAALCLVAGLGCKGDSEGSELASRDFMMFRQQVLPVLIRDCAFHACHGAPERFFRVWGPGRARMDPATRAFALMTAPELSTNLDLALSMVDQKHPERSLLLRKPLAVEAGGAGHLGVDLYGRNVYRTVNDPGYVTLRNWVMSMQMMQAPAPMTMTPAMP